MSHKLLHIQSKLPTNTDQSLSGVGAHSTLALEVTRRDGGGLSTEKRLTELALGPEPVA